MSTPTTRPEDAFARAVATLRDLGLAAIAERDDALAERDMHRENAEQIAALLERAGERARSELDFLRAQLARVSDHFVSAHDDYLAERRRADRAERRVQAVHDLLDEEADQCRDTVRIADVLAALVGPADEPAASNTDQAEPKPACPHCPDDGHRDPTSRPWGVYVAPDRDSDGQPVYLRVQPSNGAHVAESDARWLWHLIRHAPSPAAP